MSGLMDAFATSVSLALQYGVSLSVLCSKFSHMHFEPSGWSGDPKIGFATSLVDYISAGCLTAFWSSNYLAQHPCLQLK